jgi:hypothetical protein
MYHECNLCLQQCIFCIIRSDPNKVYRKGTEQLKIRNTYSRLLNTPGLVIHATRFPSIAFDAILCNILSQPTLTARQSCHPRPINLSIFSSYFRLCMCQRHCCNDSVFWSSYMKSLTNDMASNRDTGWNEIKPTFSQICDKLLLQKSFPSNCIVYEGYITHVCVFLNILVGVFCKSVYVTI